MKIETFEMERMQCLYELKVECNLSESGVLTPGDQFGLDKGFRIGFGYDLEKTLTGLARSEALMRTLI